MLEPMELINGAVTKVIGVGGDGGNVIEHMMCERIEGIEFFAVNTDTQALRKIAVGQTIQIDSGTTKGLGAGANPEVGRDVADEDRGALRAALEGTDMVFIAAGMGGGTGTGVALVVAEVVKGLGILTAAVITKPFNFEGKKRMVSAEQGIIELSKHADSLTTIPSDKLLKVLSRGIPLLDAFGAADDVLKGAAQGIVELIIHPGLMNVDLVDICTVVPETGYAMMGFGVASGEDRAEEAAKMAISSPLLGDIDLSDARGVLANITASFDLHPDEFETVGNTICVFASDSATVVTGTSLGLDMNDKLRVTIVAAGIGMNERLEATLVINKQVQQPVMDRHQRHGMAPLIQEQKPTAKVVNGNASQTTGEPNYLDIPALLCKQVD